MTEKKYEPIIGLEIHAQISTKSKMFCRCSNDSFGAEPNINTCEICMGFPGTLPVINHEAVQKALIAALALGCRIPAFSRFDRKNYFYPDLPKGYQISQYDQPLSVEGSLALPDGRKIGITRLHMEEDAGKLTHTDTATLCDYNRAGTPLMEIVSEPEIHSDEEAVSYAKEIQKILRYVGSSDADMEKGMMRFDINVSVRKKGAKIFGTKVEVKNLNSFRSLQRAILFEIQRQTELLESDGTVIHETRGYDDATGMTVSQRTKEQAQDYRYFPEPDLPPLTMNEEDIAALRLQIPELPQARKERFQKEFGLSEYDAGLLSEELDRANFFEASARISGDPKKTASFITSIFLKHLNEDKCRLSSAKITPEALGKLVKLVNEGKINMNLAKGEIFEEMYRSGYDPEDIIQEKGIEGVGDEKLLHGLCQKILEKNQDKVAVYRGGKEGLFGFFMGEAMKETRGKGDPVVLTRILKELLSKASS